MTVSSLDPAEPTAPNEPDTEEQARKRKQHQLSSDIAVLRGRSSRFYWILTWVATGVALALTVYGSVINRRDIRGDTATLQLLVTLLGVAATVGATIAITRALTRPSPAIAATAHDNREAAVALRNNIIDLARILDHAKERDDTAARNAYLDELGERILQVAKDAYGDVERWFTVEQACQDTKAELEDHLNDWIRYRRDINNIRVELRRDQLEEDVPITLAISRTIFGDDYVDRWEGERGNVQTQT